MAVFLLLLSLRTDYNYFGIIDGLAAMVLAGLSGLILVHIPVLSPILRLLGKYSGNMFLMHNQIYSYYFRSFIYSFGHWAVILSVLVLVSFLLSVFMEGVKKLLRYDRWMESIGKKIFGFK